MERIQFHMEDNAQSLDEEEIAAGMRAQAPLLKAVQKGHEEYRDSLGWLAVEEWAGEEWLSRYESLAGKVRDMAGVLVVIGIGGSNQGARAVIDAIGQKNGIRVIWAGNSISAHEINEVLGRIGDDSLFIDIIAKNFETLEPGIGFRVLRAFLKERYGEAYAQRVVCTGTEGSHLEELAAKHGYTFLPFPQNIGGRFTVLSPVGLFPMAVAGIDIRAMVRGAKAMRSRLWEEPAGENTALRFALIRNRLYEQGYRMEMLSFFEPRLFRFAKWWMQLFGESEGKEGKGLYPLFGNFSEDLHSVGQYLQEGSPVLFETFLNVKDSGSSCILKADNVDDRFDYLDGKDFDEINQAAFQATLTAHSSRYPCMVIDVPAIDEESFGQLFYFFEFVCYLSAKLLGVNPFDQPGVEAYKQHMFRILKK